MRFRRKPREPDPEFEKVLPGQYDCEYCGHRLSEHSAICMEGRCHCRMGFDELRPRAERWAKEENGRRLAEARKMMSDLREWSR